MRQSEYVKMTAMPLPSKSLNLELLFRALADRTRLRLLNLMGKDEVCVCYFVEVLKTPQPTISRHLAYLRKAGIVGARREGKWMHYRIVEPADPAGAQLLRQIRESVSSDEVLKKERSRLVQICCGKIPNRLEGAPKPVSIARLK
jgi:ArsR family transcriptional regulator